MKLNLGCGDNIREGYVNVDCRKLPGVDICCNLEDRPWPWKANSVDEILALDIVEHLDDIVAFMDEAHRVMKTGGQLVIQVPAAGYPNAWDDVTHRHLFTVRSFNHFDPETVYGAKFQYGEGKWQIIRVADGGPVIAFRMTPR